MATEVAAVALGEEWKGCLRMKQGILTHGQVCLLLSKGHSCFTVDANLREKDSTGLTDTIVPRCLGPQRASRTCKLFNLSKEDDVPQYVVRKPLNREGKKSKTKAPRIQRLVTPHVLQHKHCPIALKKQRTKKNKEEAAEYAKLAKKMKEAKEKHQEQIAKRHRLSSLRASTSKSESSQK
uniref:Small ribosomal subunit protein eS6 n=1 Tax=Chinchilla lanigera TaxID=34839 RepID=A0A8C2VHY3_CHILA